MIGNVTMIATVLGCRNGSLIVRDHANSQIVVVHTPWACRFRIGDRVRIQFSGAMTLSIPPQITAINIMRIPPWGWNR